VALEPNAGLTRLTGMRRLAAIVLIALASSGCIVSTSSTGTVITSGALPGPPATDVYISYSVPTCPPGASCVVASRDQKYYIVSRHLTCSPDGGDYTDPAAVCRALADVVTKLGKKNWSCGCLTQKVGSVDPRAMGFYKGKRRTILLDGCSLCNLRGIGADLKLLMPDAQG
jgi:hypothetical protein